MILITQLPRILIITLMVMVMVTLTITLTLTVPAELTATHSPLHVEPIGYDTIAFPYGAAGSGKGHSPEASKIPTHKATSSVNAISANPKSTSVATPAPNSIPSNLYTG